MGWRDLVDRFVTRLHTEGRAIEPFVEGAEVDPSKVVDASEAHVTGLHYEITTKKVRDFLWGARTIPCVKSRTGVLWGVQDGAVTVIGIGTLE